MGGGDADNAKSGEPGKPGGGKAPSPFEGGEVTADGGEGDAQQNGIMQNGLDAMPDRCVAMCVCVCVCVCVRVCVYVRQREEGGGERKCVYVCEGGSMYMCD